MTSNILIYQTEDGQTKIETVLQDETVWLTQEQMAELFQKARSTINEHIKNIYAEEELEEERSMKKFGNSEFAKKPTNFYNLDIIISVLQMTGNNILEHAGKVSHHQAITKAHGEYEKYKQKIQNELSRVERDFMEHIDVVAKSLKNGEPKWEK